MAKILYPQVITEDLDELKELEKYHRYSHLFQRVRMLLGSFSPSSVPTWEKPHGLWVTPGVSARGGSPPIRRAAWRSF
jgi:hypothetical protein